jgi:hypothetical protein
MKKSRFSKTLVSLLILSNVIFTIAILYIFYYTGREPSTLIISWFGFTTGELGVVGYIKGKKVKKEEEIEKGKSDYSERI